MSSPLKRVYDRLRRDVKASREGSFLAQRKRSLTLPLPPEAQQTTADQNQSAFFTKIPPEIRKLIYQEVFNGGTDVVHVTKKERKPLELVRCRDRCAMEYNYKCSAGEWLDVITPRLELGDDSEGGPLPLLQTCRRVYSEMIDTLYGYYLFDFRSFDAFLVLASTLLPQRWESIQKIHLKWHFGYGLWPGRGEERRKEDSTWNRVWRTMALMQGLREIDVDLDAYLMGDTLTSADEAEVFEPMMAVTVAPQFVIKVTWTPQLEQSASMPFRLERPVDRNEAIARMQRRLRPNEHLGQSDPLTI